MLGIFEGVNPNYSDYIFGGIMEHSSGNLYFALKGNGSCIIKSHTCERIGINCSKISKLDKKTRIFVDEYWEFNRKAFSEKLRGFNVSYLRCSSAYYADLVSRRADAVCECTRKGNLEIASAYGLVIESGGAVIDGYGKSIAERKFLDFGQDKHQIVISAATKELALNILKHIRS